MICSCAFSRLVCFQSGRRLAAMPMIQSKAVEYYHWLNMSEFTDLMTNCGDDAGSDHGQLRDLCRHRMAGIPGALVATIGCIFPSLIIVSLISWLYERYRSMDAMQAVLSCLRPGCRRADCFGGTDHSARRRLCKRRDCAFLGAAALLCAVCRGAGRFAHPSQQSDLVMVCCGAASLAAKMLLHL